MKASRLLLQETAQRVLHFGWRLARFEHDYGSNIGSAGISSPTRFSKPFKQNRSSLVRQNPLGSKMGRIALKEGKEPEHPINFNPIFIFN